MYVRVPLLAGVGCEEASYPVRCTNNAYYSTSLIHYAYEEVACRRQIVPRIPMSVDDHTHVILF